MNRVEQRLFDVLDGKRFDRWPSLGRVRGWLNRKAPRPEPYVSVFVDRCEQITFGPISDEQRVEVENYLLNKWRPNN